jgi:hypothetical protein
LKGGQIHALRGPKVGGSEKGAKREGGGREEGGRREGGGRREEERIFLLNVISRRSSPKRLYVHGDGPPQLSGLKLLHPQLLSGRQAVQDQHCPQHGCPWAWLDTGHPHDGAYCGMWRRTKATGGRNRMKWRRGQHSNTAFLRNGNLPLS